ncbi:MAG: hypothetical protein HC881_22590 [Leptolyngbyaceae cyanobacterium SL_7_1]|nr:hypothetical protein [Leptolyngbyaceae cyanobacterium SM1_4_3]NJN88560.1 hypothetical protein [Leptolyngbyaceae cyanobacterium SL_7_1]
MLVALIIFLGLSPALVSFWMMQRVQAQTQARLQRTTHSVSIRRTPLARGIEYQYVDGIGYMIGDLSCRFNARSNYIRCAVNPYGPCQNCPFYEARQLSPY